MYYFYETHTGEGIFVSNKKIPTKDLCCDMCGGEDIYLGKASNAIEAWEVLKNRTVISFGDFQTTGYLLSYIKELINTVEPNNKLDYDTLINDFKNNYFADMEVL